MPTKGKKKQADVAVITQTQIGTVMLHVYPESSADAQTTNTKQQSHMRITPSLWVSLKSKKKRKIPEVG